MVSKGVVNNYNRDVHTKWGDGTRLWWSHIAESSPIADNLPKSPQISFKTLHAVAHGTVDSTTTSGICSWCGYHVDGGTGGRA